MVEVAKFLGLTVIWPFSTMGAAISKGAKGIGTLLGNAVVAPIKSVFGGSCEGVCPGIWDITCFIEHLCVSNLLKLLMVLGLCYIILLVFYLMFQVGICQCIARSLCKMCWAACQTYWFLFEYITCFVWHKLKNTNRVNRRRRRCFRDVEVGCSSDGETVSLEVDQSFNTRKLRRKRKDRVESSFYPSRQNRYANDSHRNHPRFKGDRYQRFKYSRQLQMRKLSNIRRESTLFKKRGFSYCQEMDVFLSFERCTMD
ncbi:uncharacterized protein LOC131336083 isoform X2 [Rhododendron vialii]|uniref:uncharacterized protein LOC131336083 isoform X2 n=1 Tax=Rhododendron vialii TaxID=182163 RepID=UPI00265DCEFE|nr:uncharacterized protein LOC131336083 isoform X2 [Rhododendron vialii]